MFDSTDYLDWRRQAEQAGLAHRASIAYYDNREQFYRVEVDGESYTIPIVTTDEWCTRTNDMNRVVGQFTPECVEQHDDEILDAVAKTAAYIQDDDLASQVTDYFWNGQSYRLTDISPNSSDFGFGVTTYFSRLSTTSALMEELHQHLYQQDVDVDASIDTLASTIQPGELEERDTSFPSVDALMNQTNPVRGAGVNALVVMNTGDDYRIPFGKRSQQVVEAPGWWSLVPGGALQPRSSPAGPPSLRRDILVEFAEELFGYEDEDDILGTDIIQELEQQFETGGAVLDYVGSGIQSRKAILECFGLLYIEDAAYYQEFEDRLSDNFESDRIEWVSVQDGDRLQSLLTPRTLNPYILMGVFEGLQRLEAEYDIPTGIDISRQGPF